MSFWTSYGVALATVTGILAILFVAARYIELRRARSTRGGRYVSVLDSTMLSPHASVHVVRFGGRVILIGISATAISRLATVEDDARST
ncbi:MAG: FliO/MopB family protein [Candidatus Eremiobacteraeota bacterium]|nr:FliO/MopB family protein [Candidatus Eremiobacteraeota bacterium]